MKQIRLLPLLLILLTGCAQTAPDTAVQTQETAAETEQETQTEAPAAPITAGGTVPVIALTTADQSADVLDFITEPVAQHVAQSIRSWTPGYKMPPAPYYEACTVTVTDADGGVLLEAPADVKVRGNWTTSYDKKPLRIKFEGKQPLLGLHDGEAYKNWVLLAEYKDGSMLRNYTALSVGRELLGADGLYCADAALAEVTVNEQYWGLYLVTEQQQTAHGRVDITEPEKDYTGTDIGYFLEFDGYYTQEDALHGFKVDYADNAPLIGFDGDEEGRSVRPLSDGRDRWREDVGMSIKSDIYSQAQHDFIKGFVNNAYRVMYAAAYDDQALVIGADGSLTEDASLTPQEAVERVVNTDSLADMYILSELTCDADIYWSSFFLSADFGEGGDGRLTFEAPWDFDSALGNKDRCADGTGFYAANIVPDVNNNYETVNPWLAVLMHEDWFCGIIREKWTRAADAGVFDRAVSEIAAVSEADAAAFDRNYLRWDNLRHNAASGELTRRAAHCFTQKEAADYLTEWLTTRVAFLDDYWYGAS